MKFPKVIAAGLAGLLSLSMAACGSNGGGGSQDTVEWKLAFNQTEDHPQYKAAVALGERLSEVTEGRYTIKPYANEQLGSQADVIQNVSDGTVEMMYVGGPVMEGFNPDFIVYNLPYMFDSIEAQQAVFRDTELNAELFASVEEEKNITVLGAFHAGVRNVYNSARPITKPEDLNGLKIRVQQSESQTRMIELMGATASPMGQGEVYSALQQKVLDGAENNETVFHALKHDEVATYYSYTRHLMIPDYLLISSKALNDMSDADREAFLKLIPEIQDMADTGMQEFVASSIEEAQAKGAQFNDDVDTEAFKTAVQPLVQESIGDVALRKTLYEAIQAANEEHPAKK